MYKIRDATINDFDQVYGMAKKFYAMTTYPDQIPIDQASSFELFEGLLNTGFVLVAEEEGRLIGMMGVMIAPFMLNTNHLTATELMWWVEPDKRGSKIALSFLALAEERAQERGCTFLAMTKLRTSPDVVDRIYTASGYVDSESAYLKRL
jgi:GNAT superfamily N-acetyltransferase